ncbi:MAG: hypothetical protein ACLGIT_14395 [Gammaproteobacteria bacterium]|uniref:hypothetical protein n=1 Tax=Azohydromonas sp. TaxID=1872666 RepID=UPI002BE5AB0F|nr:hypothetical protein [Azohydromonas sp.]HMM87299.1 hypothetical protein [Azohydromonas sp.]
MDRRTLAVLTWLTVVAAVVSALWLALGAGAKRFGVAPLVLGRPMPPAEDAKPGSAAGRVAPRPGTAHR